LIWTVENAMDTGSLDSIGLSTRPYRPPQNIANGKKKCFRVLLLWCVVCAFFPYSDFYGVDGMDGMDRPRIYWVSCFLRYGQQAWTRPKGMDSLAKK
jgi:hypothetical protein